LFPVVCSKFGATWFNAEVNATEVKTLISAALPTAAASKGTNPLAAASAKRFTNDVWIMHPLPRDKNSNLCGHPIFRTGY
jgi:hypothetical protein